jgi:transposase InsO family protein
MNRTPPQAPRSVAPHRPTPPEQGLLSASQGSIMAPAAGRHRETGAREVCPGPGHPRSLRIAIVTWIERTYHRRRRQNSLGRLTPIEFETGMTAPAIQAGCVTEPDLPHLPGSRAGG